MISGKLPQPRPALLWILEPRHQDSSILVCCHRSFPCAVLLYQEFDGPDLAWPGFEAGRIVQTLAKLFLSLVAFTP